MFVSSMTAEEKKTEALKDFGLMQTKIDMALDTFRKHLRLGTLASPIKRITISTKNKNTWTITFAALCNCISIFIYAPIQNRTRNGFIALSDIVSPNIMEYTGHFFQRYNERYLAPNNIKTGALTILEYFQQNNHDYIFKKKEDGYCIVSNHGYMVGLIPTDRMMVYLTFIGNENLSSTKSDFYSKKLCELNAANELLNYPEKITTEVLSKIVHKHNVGPEFIDDWERWYS